MANGRLPPLGTEVIGKTPEGRSVIRNPDGTVSTERTVTVVHPLINGGRPTNIPTIFAGREFDEDTAAQIILEFARRKKKSTLIDPETGRELQAFDSMEAATKAAQARSREIGQSIRGLIEAISRGR